MAAPAAYLASIEVRISPAGIVFCLPSGVWRFDGLALLERD